MNEKIEKSFFFQDIKINFDSSSFILNNTNLKLGFEIFTKALEEQKPELLKNNFLYINIWSIVCKPCSDEIPFLDSLPQKINKSISYLMVSSHSEDAVTNFLKNKEIQMKNFIFVNEMIDFISGIYNEIEVKNQSFPLHVVLDKEGNCLAYLFGSIDDMTAAPLVNFINNLD
jgi:thiol-disulfide isomerase/thioredoxin